ncbi:MAG: GTPase HflX [Spirochaetales bacterium]|nr:GTPase HflX [Candidatus Physcosoma equi]
MSEERAMLITTRTVGENERSVFLREAEIRSLVNTLGLSIVCHQSFTIKEENNVTYLGRGQAESAAEYSRAFDIDEVIIDVFLSPRQEMKLEEIFGLPISDREAVIQAIFFHNAHSREARLQIEKAQAQYLKPRLIFREANFSQQRGGVRGAKGEGEKALELQRRTIEMRIKALEKEIAEVKKTRATQRVQRERTGIFTFALTGYTNAGKSTILNRLTNAGILAEDKLFATLDTTTRSLELPNSQKVLLSDTVGFIQNLPSLLVEASSSTLEEALNADAVIIVADASHPDAKTCFDTTRDTLEALDALDRVKLLVINKIDAIYDDISYQYLKSQPYRIVETSMKDEKGIEDLLAAMAEITDEAYEDVTLLIPYGSPLLNELSLKDAVKDVVYEEHTIKVFARIPSTARSRYENWIL